MGQHDEVETKYDVDDDFELPAVAELLAGLAPADDDGASGRVDHGGVDHYALEATYFDTADHRLLHAGLTLRRRTGGHDDGWHLKLPIGADTRREVTAALGRSATTVPIRLRRMVWIHTRDEPLVPVLRLATQRTEHHLVSASSELAAEAPQVLADIADDRVTATRLVGGAEAGAVTWHELEVELVHGDRALLKRVGKQLRRWGATRSASSSKLVRGIGIEPDLGRSTRAVERTLRRLTARSTAGEVIVAYVARELDRIREQDIAVRLDQPDSIHTMRVATRRIRSALKTFAPLFDADRIAPFEIDLKWLADELGRARDAEVLRTRLLDAVGTEQARHLSTARVTQTVDREMSRAQKAAVAEVTAALDSDRYRELVIALEDLVADPPLAGKANKPAGKVLPPLVAATYEQVRRAVLAGSALPDGDERDHLLHEARKAAKQTRYAAEAVSPAFGRPAKRYAAAMELVQAVLGERQDSVVLQQRLHALALEGPPQLSFTYGRLHARESGHQDRVDASVTQAWKVAAKKSLRAWLA